MTVFLGKYVYINEYRCFLFRYCAKCPALISSTMPIDVLVFFVIANKAEKLHR